MVGRVVVIRYSLFVYPFSGSLRQVLRKVEVKGSPALGISSSFGKVPNSQFQVSNSQSQAESYLGTDRPLIAQIMVSE